MNGAPAGGSGPPQPPPSSSDGVRHPWLTPDLVSALRPSLYPSGGPPNPFLAASEASRLFPGGPVSTSAGALPPPFLHPHHPGSALHSPYGLYNPLTAAGYHAAAAAALGNAGHRPPFLDPSAFLGARYRYLLPSSGARFPPPTAERSASESEAAGPGRPSAWRRPNSPPKPPDVSAPATNRLRSPLEVAQEAAVARFRAPAPTAAPTLPTQPYYPSHFMRGTVIQLASGELKRVEELNTEDFVRSANLSSALKMDSSTVVRVEEKTKDIVLLCFSVGENKVQVSVEATVEHPFFVIGQGWSSCSPERTRSLYGLPCQRLQVGDICISLTHRDVSSSTASPSAALASSIRRAAAAAAAPVVKTEPLEPTPTPTTSAAAPKRPSSNPALDPAPKGPTRTEEPPSKRKRRWSFTS